MQECALPGPLFKAKSEFRVCNRAERRTSKSTRYWSKPFTSALSPVFFPVVTSFSRQSSWSMACNRLAQQVVYRVPGAFMAFFPPEEHPLGSTTHPKFMTAGVTTYWRKIPKLNKAFWREQTTQVVQWEVSELKCMLVDVQMPNVDVLVQV